MSKPKIRFKNFTDDWEQRKLGEIANFSKGQGYTKSDLKENGTPIILYGQLYTKYRTIIRKIDTYADVIKDAVFSNGGEVILPSSGETAEDIAIAATVEKSGVLLGGGLNIVIPNVKILSAFLALQITYGTPHYELAKKAQGKSIVHLYNDDLRSIKISFPTRKEQKIISTFFDNIDSLITLHQRKCEQAKKFKKFMLQKMFPENGKNVPGIRLKGFSDAWEQRKLSEIANKVTEKNKDNIYNEPLTNSAELGIISQKDYFDREVVTESNLDNYYVIQNGDFVYNPRVSTSAPVGPINCNKLGRNGIMSPLYTVFRTHSINTLYLEYYFKTTSWHRFMKLNGDSGARFDRFTISSTKFMKMPIPYPQIDEQEKIGTYFKSLDSLITLHQRKCDEYKKLKKFMLQNMFV